MRFLVWFALGFLSSSMAEVISSSHPQGIFDVWGISVIFPLYTLHTLVLAGILFRIGVNWQRLFLFGCIFGMYEAYITKVFWNPFWGPKEFEFVGVYWFQLSVLAFFWHPFFAFILPLLIVERFFTTSSTILKSIKGFPLLKRFSRVVVVFPAIFGLIQSSNTPASTSAVFGAANLLIMTALIVLLRDKKLRMEEIIPSGKELKILVALLVLFYAVTTFTIRFEAIGSLISQLVIIGLYLLFIVLIVKNRELTGAEERVEKEKFTKFYLYFAIYIFSAVVGVALPHAVGMLIILAGTAYGIFTFLLILAKTHLNIEKSVEA